MSIIKRYTPSLATRGGMILDPEGPYVLTKDYDALAGKPAKEEALNKGAKQLLAAVRRGRPAAWAIVGFEEEQRARAEKAESREARIRDTLELILSEPHGCPRCDSGRLRYLSKPHFDCYGFEKAREALASR